MSGGGGGSGIAVRRNVAALDGGAIERLRRGFRVLRERSAQDAGRPTGLLGQANIHRDRCSHATWWFLPWHRAYLRAFEGVLREAAGDPGLTLPYWDWSTSPRLPEAFWGQNNPLSDQTREITATSVADAAFAGRTVVERILGITDFVTFASERSADPLAPEAFGAIEGTPHNYIHRFVGGNNGNMGDPVRAARDPIFWLHHANIDRLWAEWVARHPDRTTTDPAWLGQTFDFFDPQGRALRFAVADLLDTRRLGYEYDTQPAPRAGGGTVSGRSAATGGAGGAGGTGAAGGPPPAMRAEAPPGQAAIGRRPVTMTLGPAAPLLPSREASPAPGEAASGAASTVRLQVEGMAPGGNPDVGVRVFLNLPGADAATSVDDPHYVTTFAFFEHVTRPQDAAHGEQRGHEGHEGHETHGGPKTFYADLTPTLQALAAAGLYRDGQPLQVTLVTVPIDPGRADRGDATIPFRAVSITVPD